MPNSIEGFGELASVRSELCPCFECSEQSDSSLFCSSSSTAHPTSCFNRGYHPSPYLVNSLPTSKTNLNNSLSKFAYIFGATPKGWLVKPELSLTTPKTKDGKTAKNIVSGSKATTPITKSTPGLASCNVPWFKTTPTGADRDVWHSFVKDFSLQPESITSFDDRLPLKFISDHDLLSSTLPSWDLYRVIKTIGK